MVKEEMAVLRNLHPWWSKFFDAQTTEIYQTNFIEELRYPALGLSALAYFFSPAKKAHPYYIERPSGQFPWARLQRFQPGSFGNVKSYYW